MSIVLLVGVGGFFGSVARYLVSRGFLQLLDQSSFPYGTLTVNVIGCLIIGLLSGTAEARGILGAESHIRALIFIGFLGGFTTFSAFGYETITLTRNDQIVQAFANVVLQLTLGLGAVLVGYKLALSLFDVQS